MQKFNGKVMVGENAEIESGFTSQTGMSKQRRETQDKKKQKDNSQQRSPSPDPFSSPVKGNYPTSDQTLSKQKLMVFENEQNKHKMWDLEDEEEEKR